MSQKFTFENKMRLIGYYNHPNQNIHCENKFIEEAERLAKLLNKSFDSLRDDKSIDPIFKSILNSNAVFILKDEENNLFAYSLSTNIARISDVVYNKNGIIQMPFEYKNWFIPGDDINIKTKASKSKQSKRYSVTAPGTDFLITDNKKSKTLPLKWDEDKHISFKELSSLINEEWITLSEYETKEDCVDCDGYDYSNCDDDRCDGVCEGCGGRRYKCNRFCFSYRYKERKAFKCQPNYDIVTKRLTDFLGILELISKPHTEHSTLFYQYQKSLKDAYEHCNSLKKYYDIPSDSIIETFISKMDYCTELNEGRNNLNDSNSITLYKNDKKVLCVNRKDIKCESSGILIFKTYHLKSTSSTYDSVSDSILEFDYEFGDFIQDDFKKKLKKEINKVSAIYMDNKKSEMFIVTKLI